MATKHKADEVNDRVPGFSGIKTEPSGDDTDKCDVDSKEPIKTMSELESPTTSGIVEQVFIKKEDDPDAGGTASTSIKSEPPGDEWDKCIPEEDKSIVEMETENYKLDLEMSGKVKPELLIKKEWDDDPAAVYEVSASRIKKDSDESVAGPAGGVKQEADMEDDEDYQLTEDCDIKSESDASMDAASDGPSNRTAKCITASQPSPGLHQKKDKEFFRCDDCNYSTSSERQLITHSKRHSNQKSVHISKPDIDVPTCTQCHASFKSKTALDGHLKSKHPLVSGKKHKFSICVLCDAKCKNKKMLDVHVAKKHKKIIKTGTSKLLGRTEKASSSSRNKTNFDRHNPEKTVSSNKLITCIQCDKTFKRKITMYDHVLRKHPELIKSVTYKIYECTECLYKTTFKGNYLVHVSKHSHTIYECAKCRYKTTIKSELIEHMSVHTVTKRLYVVSGSGSERKRTCICCSGTFRKTSAFDEHVLKKHPNFVKSITRKIYECTDCIYKTTEKNKLMKHTSVHTDKITCAHCNKILAERSALDEHIVKKHPNFSTEVTRKIHECTECNYMTTVDGKFYSHMLLHSETSPSFNHVTCTYCDLTFIARSTLDEHVLEKHPESITSITRKIYKCVKCTYKTTMRTSFQSHMSVHIERHTCGECKATFGSESALEEHQSKNHPINSKRKTQNSKKKQLLLPRTCQ